MISRKILELNLATRRVTRRDDSSKAISQRIRFLYLMSQGYTSAITMLQVLSIAKPNLTLLTKQMSQEGLIEKFKDTVDRRTVHYRITELGIQELNNSFTELEEELRAALTNDEYDGIEEKLGSAIDVLKIIN